MVQITSLWIVGYLDRSNAVSSIKSMTLEWYMIQSEVRVWVDKQMTQ